MCRRLLRGHRHADGPASADFDGVPAVRRDPANEIRLSIQDPHPHQARLQEPKICHRDLYRRQAAARLLDGSRLQLVQRHLTMDRASTCAIGVMAKAPQPGRAKTRLCPPLQPTQAAELSAAFLRDITENIALASRSAPIHGCIAYAPKGDEGWFHGHLADG